MNPNDVDWERLDHYVSGRGTPEELAALERWVDRDPELRALVDAMQTVARPPGVAPRAWDAPSAWRRVRRRMRLMGRPLLRVLAVDDDETVQAGGNASAGSTVAPDKTSARSSSDLSKRTIDELIARHWKRRTSDAEERAIHAWCDASELNERYYWELISVLELAVATHGHERIPTEPSAGNLFHLREWGTEQGWGTSRPFWKRRGVLRVIAAAATIVLLLGGGEWWRRSLSPHPEFQFGAGEFVTGSSETATVTLDDGTVVRIAPKSRLRVNNSPGRRDVFLVGKAYFAVAKMEDYPFRVRTRLGEVTALGTRFEVTTGEDLRVVVAEGRVAVDGAKDRVEVNGGEMSIVTGAKPSSPVKVNVAPMFAWVGRFLAFQSTPLHRVAAELEQEYAVRVIVTDSALAELTVTGSYVDRSFEEVLTIICAVVGARCWVQDGIATIDKQRAPTGG